MKNVLVVVDMQKDFIDGALGTKEAEAVVDKVAETIRSFEGDIVFTRDTHFENYLETQEGRNLPVVHCIKDTEGWQIDRKLAALCPNGMKIFDKVTFGSVALAEYLKADKELECVTLAGLCTDICVISNGSRHSFPTRRSSDLMLCRRDTAKPQKCTRSHENVPNRDYVKTSIC